jgi:FlaA1/EpsC-like NDP-sugar epimerase
MGASKKLMEEVILAYAHDLKISTARFANVAFSNGSLPAGFVERIMKQQPLSCPSNVRRYFVSPQESGEICLMSCILGNSGEIFFPKLDPNRDLVYFANIAKAFLEELGYEPLICNTENEAREMALHINNGQYPLYLFESDTSGEKLVEEFHTSEEDLEMDRFHALGVVRNTPRRSKEELNEVISDLNKLFSKEITKDDIVIALNSLLPNFRHVETGMNLDQKM